MRRASAAARHEVWLLGFAGTLLLPVAVGRAARLARAAAGEGAAARPPPAAVVRSRRAACRVAPHRRTAPAATASRPGVRRGPTALRRPTPLERPLAGRRRRSAARRRERSPVPAVPAPARIAATRPASAPAAVRTAERPAVDGLADRWLGRRQRAGAVPRVPRPPEPVVAAAAAVRARHRGRDCSTCSSGSAAEAGVRRPVELLSSPARTMPMTWGLWRGPAARARRRRPTGRAGQRRDVLLHELGPRPAVGLPDPTAGAGRVRRVLVQPAGVGRQPPDAGRARAGLRRPGAQRRRRAARRTPGTCCRASRRPPRSRLVAAAVAMARPSTLEERMRAILNHRLNRRGPDRPRQPGDGVVAAVGGGAGGRPRGAAAARAGDSAGAPAKTVGEPNGRRGETAEAAGRPGGTPAAGRATRRPARRLVDGAAGGAAASASSRTAAGRRLRRRRRADPRRGPHLLVRRHALRRAHAGGPDRAGSTSPPWRRRRRPPRRSRRRWPHWARPADVPGQPVRPAVRRRHHDRLARCRSSRTPGMTDKGQSINTVQYQSVGADLHPRRQGRRGPGARRPGPGHRGVVVVRRAGRRSPTRSRRRSCGRPTCRTRARSSRGSRSSIVSVDAGSTDKDGKAVAYIGRITLGEPQQPAPQ